MGKRYRYLLMILSIIVLLCLGLKFYNNIYFINEFWCASGLLMIILLSLVDQPFFSKDSNIFVNSVTACLALLLVVESEKNLLFWGLVFLTAYLLISSCALMWVRTPGLNNEIYIIQIASKLNRVIGRPNFLFSLFFLWGIHGKFFYDRELFLELVSFWLIFLAFNTNTLYNIMIKIIPALNDVSNYENNMIGENFGVQSEYIFLAKIYKSATINIKKFDKVDFIYGIDRKLHIGIVLDIYYLNQERWIKIYSIEEKDNNYNEKKDNVVYKINDRYLDCSYKNLVGLIAEESTIDRIRFEYLSLNRIEEGQLLQLGMNNEKVIYQIVNGITKTDILELKNESSKIIGEAIQLGKWDKDNKRFIKNGWVPTINTPLFLVEDIEKVNVENYDYIIGSLPQTNFPVIMNKEIAITHHTAILGITGSGKSVFARNLINQIATQNSKVIVIDITGEYIEKDKTLEPIISDEVAKEIYTLINALNKEMAEFKNNRNLVKIDNNKKIINERINNSIDDFIKSDKIKTIFTLSNIVNEVSAIDYTKWFLLSLFDYVKMNKNIPRICVVLEEAHTIVPEWNSMGIDDNSSKASINSIAQIALQGRKYNIGFIVIAQRTANVSKTVLTQCNSIITFQELDSTTLDFLSNYMGKQFISVIPTLKSQQAIAVGKAFRSNTPMIFNVPEIKEK